MWLQVNDDCDGVILKAASLAHHSLLVVDSRCWLARQLEHLSLAFLCGLDILISLAVNVSRARKYKAWA